MRIIFEEELLLVTEDEAVFVDGTGGRGGWRLGKAWHGAHGLLLYIPIAVSSGGGCSGCGCGCSSRLCVSVGCISTLQERREPTLQTRLPPRAR